MKTPSSASPLRSWRLHLATACTALCATLASPVSAQVLLEENFTFTGPLTSNGWSQVGTTTTNPINSSTPGLMYPNLPSSGVGNAADLVTTGQDVSRTISPANTTGAVYASFLVNLSAAQATGDYFFTMGTGTSSFFARTFARSSGAGFQLGIQKGSTTPATYASDVLNFGTTYLVVAKITRDGGAGIASLWVNPVLGGAETTPLVQNTAGSDPATIDNVYLRQGTAGNAPTLRVGSILVGTTWASVTPTASASAPTITSFSPTGGQAGTAVTINGTNFIGASAVTFNGAPAVFSVVSSIQINATVPAAATAGAIQITTPAGVATSADNFVIPTVAVTVPVQINEGATATGTVTLTEAPGSDVIVALTSSSPSDLVVPSSVTVAAGFTSTEFEIEAPRDDLIDDDVEVTVTPFATGYAGAPATILVRNIDVPAASLTVAGYTQNFATFSAATPTLPEGWSAIGSVLIFPPTDNAWGEAPPASTSGYRGAANVFGYQHTGSTGVLQQILTLRNDTASEINDLVVSYTGRMAIESNGRTPSYTVTVDGLAYPALAYSTSEGPSVPKAVAVTGLIIAPGQTFQIVWTSDGSTSGSPGSGSRRQIGISDLSVTIGSTVLPPTVANLAVPLGSITQTSVAADANVTADNGAPITARGFVYSPTSVNSDPLIGGAGVVNVADAAAETGPYSATLTGLVGGTQYSIKAYAINAEGTTYTNVRTFTTLSAPLAFSGNYAEPFNDFSSTTSPSLASGILKSGWTAVSSGGIQGYSGVWTSGSSNGGFYGGTTDPGVVGYQHTADTGTMTVTLRVVNDTGAPLSQLYVKYLGRVQNVAQIRLPQWDVTVAGVAAPDLTYSTGSGVDETKSALVTGLDVPAGGEFTIVWASQRGDGGGSSRRIGLANVVVSTSAIADPAISVTGSLTPFATTVGTASASQSFNASGAGLTGNITVTAPASYEVSLDNTTFAASVTLPSVSGTVASTPVYVRIAASAPLGSPAGTVSLTSTGATTQSIAVTGTVNPPGTPYDAWADSYGLNPATNGAPTADPDGDSFSNAQEFAFGTNPTQGNAALTQASVAGGNLTVTFVERDSGVTYAVENTTNLAAGPWNPASVTKTTATDQTGVPTGYTRKQFSVPATGNGFYRVTATTP